MVARNGSRWDHQPGQCLACCEPAAARPDHRDSSARSERVRRDMRRVQSYVLIQEVDERGDTVCGSAKGQLTALVLLGRKASEVDCHAARSLKLRRALPLDV